MELGKDMAIPAARREELKRRANSCSVRFLLWYYFMHANTFQRYLLNPYLLLPTLALSTSTLENAALLAAVAFACERMYTNISTRLSADVPFLGRSSASILLLAILTHLSFSSIIYVIPVLLLLISSPVSNLVSPRPFALDFKGLQKALLPLAGEYAAYMAVLTVASTLVCGGSWAWAEKTWGSLYVALAFHKSNVY